MTTGRKRILIAKYLKERIFTKKTKISRSILKYYTIDIYNRLSEEETNELYQELYENKNILKDRMVVELRNGQRYMVVGTRLLSCKGYMSLELYDDHLKCCDPLQVSSHNRPWDIVKVFDVVNYFELDSVNEDTLLWERDEESDEKE